jgi:hypothetical protein
MFESNAGPPPNLIAMALLFVVGIFRTKIGQIGGLCLIIGVFIGFTVGFLTGC